MKLSVVELTDNVGSGAVTVRVTGIKTGDANPVALMLTEALNVPTGRPDGLTRTVNAAGSLPVSGLTVSHSAFGGVTEVVYAAVLDPDFTAKDCAAGRVLPDCHVKVIETGVGVKTAVCPKTDNPASAMPTKSRVVT